MSQISFDGGTLAFPTAKEVALFDASTGRKVAALKGPHDAKFHCCTFDCVQDVGRRGGAEGMTTRRESSLAARMGPTPCGVARPDDLLYFLSLRYLQHSVYLSTTSL
jgi:hypothetical protein